MKPNFGTLTLRRKKASDDRTVDAKMESLKKKLKTDDERESEGGREGREEGRREGSREGGIEMEMRGGRCNWYSYSIVIVIRLSDISELDEVVCRI